MKQFEVFHEGKKRFKCSLCERIFIVYKMLLKHILIAHEGEKPFECNNCDEKFENEKTLLLHLSVHMEKKPTKAPINHKPNFATAISGI